MTLKHPDMQHSCMVAQALELCHSTYDFSLQSQYDLRPPSFISQIDASYDNDNVISSIDNCGSGVL